MKYIAPFLLSFCIPLTAHAQSAWPDGAVPRSVVQAKMAETRENLYACYQKHVPASSRKHGDVLKVRVIATEAGDVFRVDFLESSYRSDAFETCAREALSKVDFGVKATKKTEFVQTIGLQQGVENLKFEAPRPAGGAITKESVEGLAEAHSDEIRACYQAALETNPELRGQVLVELVIDGRTGAVKSARKVKSTLGHAAAESCLLNLVRSFAFGIPSDPGLVIIQYPFTFTSD